MSGWRSWTGPNSIPYCLCCVGHSGIELIVIKQRFGQGTSPVFVTLTFCAKKELMMNCESSIIEEL
jgi:hypothetical protein